MPLVSSRDASLKSIVLELSGKEIFSHVIQVRAFNHGHVRYCSVTDPSLVISTVIANLCSAIPCQGIFRCGEAPWDATSGIDSYCVCVCSGGIQLRQRAGVLIYSYWDTPELACENKLENSFT